MKRNIPFVNALAWIVASTLLISGSAYSAFKWCLHSRAGRGQVAPPCIQSILQTGPHQEALKTIYLAELLNLSTDRPSLSSSFDHELAERMLLASSVIKEAKVKLFNPTTLYIDYSVRKPIALLYDYENTAIDQEGHLFPLIPFFSPKNLPEIYLGLPSGLAASIWQKPIHGRQIELAFALLALFGDPKLRDILHVRWIDLSRAFADSYGKREIVLILEDEILKKEKEKEVSFLFPRFLRLSTKNYAKELGNYLKLREEMLASEATQLAITEKTPASTNMHPVIIDLRIPQLAFIKEGSQQ